MKKLSAEELVALREREPVEVINVLSADAFAEERIPGTRNVPLEGEEFVDRVRRTVGGEGRKVVVYCASEDCQASAKAAERLEQAGFTQVYDLPAGIQGWKDAGFELVGSQTA